jgi:RNA polymerase sigma factor (sigma-70 family)
MENGHPVKRAAEALAELLQVLHAAQRQEPTLALRLAYHRTRQQAQQALLELLKPDWRDERVLRVLDWLDALPRTLQEAQQLVPRWRGGIGVVTRRDLAEEAAAALELVAQVAVEHGVVLELEVDQAQPEPEADRVQAQAEPVQAQAEPEADQVQAQADQVQAALARLSERDRRLVKLWREGRSYKEIAEDLKVQPATVSRRVKLLRKELGPGLVPRRK